MLLNLSFSYQNVKIERAEKGGFKIVHMHFRNRVGNLNNNSLWHRLTAQSSQLIVTALSPHL